MYAPGASFGLDTESSEAVELVAFAERQANTAPRSTEDVKRVFATSATESSKCKRRSGARLSGSLQKRACSREKSLRPRGKKTTLSSPCDIPPHGLLKACFRRAVDDGILP